MTTVPTEVYGPGGADPAKPNQNIVATGTMPVSTDQANRDSMSQQAVQALVNNRTYLALNNPSTAQNTAQVKALTRQMTAIIRLVLNQVDATD